MITKLLSDNDLIAKRTILNNEIDTILASNRKTLKTTVRDKLRLLNDELIRFKSSGVSYKIIRSLLDDRVGLKVSEQTLREHCQQELGFIKRGQTAASHAISRESKRVTAQDQQAIHDQGQGQGQGNEQVNLITTNPTKPTTPSLGDLPVSEQINQQTTELLNKLENY